MSSILGVAQSTVVARSAHKARLCHTGFVARDYINSGFIALNGKLRDVLAPPRKTITKITSELVGTVSPPSCDWDDFEHLGEERNLVLNVLTGALGKRATGINILLYGMPGTGKTEFCKVVSRQLGATLYNASDDDENEDDQPSRHRRFAQLKLAQNVLKARPNSIILLDEMEDILLSESIFSSDNRSSMSKAYLNKLLEDNTVPTLWTCNNIERFDPAFLRRMTLAVEIRTPSITVRERVWKKTLERHRMKIDQHDIRVLANEFDAAPALAANAVRAAKLAGGTVSQLRLSIRSATKAMAGGIESPPVVNLAQFEPELSSADTDLIALVEKLRRPDTPLHFSLCLSGPSGTGKSAFARYLAHSLGLPVLQKRASDLMNKWVGGTEKNIAAAFAEARANRAFLIFDEADSLLGDRTNAERSWEISQVNEMLTWMESHELPFACTTNLMDRIDPASLRRFMLKVRFSFLTAKQSAMAFTQFFGLSAPAGLRELGNLTPGDFALVQRKAKLIGVDDADGLLRMLRDESEIKGEVTRQIGYRIGMG